MCRKTEIYVGLYDLRQPTHLFCIIVIASLFLYQSKFIVKFNKVISDTAFSSPEECVPLLFENSFPGSLVLGNLQTQISDIIPVGIPKIDVKACFQSPKPGAAKIWQ